MLFLTSPMGFRPGSNP